MYQTSPRTSSPQVRKRYNSQPYSEPMSLYIHLQFDYRSLFPHPRLQIPARSAIFLLSLPSCASIFTTIRCFNLFFLGGFRAGIVDVECDLCHCWWVTCETSV